MKAKTPAAPAASGAAAPGRRRAQQRSPDGSARGRKQRELGELVNGSARARGLDASHKELLLLNAEQVSEEEEKEEEKRKRLALKDTHKYR